MPVATTALDYMHNFYSIIKEMHNKVLDEGYLLDAAGWRLMEENQWRCWVNVQTTVMWICWRDKNDKIPHREPPIPSNAKHELTFRRYLDEVYQLLIYLSVAERILASKAISMDEVGRGQHYLQKFSQGMLALGAHLVINHHMSMHYSLVFKSFGPAHAWWLFAFERCNGEQEAVNLNGHAEGEMETTLMRNWLAKQRLYELVEFVSMPENTSPEERKLMSRVTTQKGMNRGTLHTQLAGFGTGATVFFRIYGSIRMPNSTRRKKETRFINLRSLPHAEVYGLLLSYAHSAWPDLNIVDDFTTFAGFIPLSASHSAIGIPFLYRDGIRYGSSLDGRSQADRHACVDFTHSRVPCRLLYHFKLSITGKPHVFCSIVQRMKADERIPTMPWSMYATELGIYIAYHDTYHDLEVVPTDKLAAAVALLPTTSCRLGTDVPL
ncbi:hypothetical protein BKA93DRAFT_815915 [Sparassis latifolia]